VTPFDASAHQKVLRFMRKARPAGTIRDPREAILGDPLHAAEFGVRANGESRMVFAQRHCVFKGADRTVWVGGFELVE
jgi:hypothetical protein